MNIKSSISPDLFKTIIIGLSAIGVYTLWTTVDKQVNDWGFEPVYGQQNAQVVSPVREELSSLPIVVAKKQEASFSLDESVNDALIEAAFKEPEPIVAEESVEPVVTLGQRFFALYRPAISAVSAGGAVINGVFWQPGEPIASMVVHRADGTTVLPAIVSSSSNGVVISLGEEFIRLPFSGI